MKFYKFRIVWKIYKGILLKILELKESEKDYFFFVFIDYSLYKGSRK